MILTVNLGPNKIKFRFIHRVKDVVVISNNYKLSIDFYVMLNRLRPRNLNPVTPFLKQIKPFLFLQPEKTTTKKPDEVRFQGILSSCG